MNIPLVKVPTFEMTLPFSKRVIKFRPYLVKEEKLLIMANESNNTDNMAAAMGDIVAACTNDEVLFGRDPLFDVQYAFLQIRGKSQGEQLDFYCICGNPECKKKTPAALNVSDFTLATTPGHSNRIEFSSDYVIKMRYPTFEHYHALYESDEEDAIYDVVAKCIDTIVAGDEIFTNDDPHNYAEFREFVDNMTPEQFEMFEHFFITMPVLQHTIEYECRYCNTKNTLTVDGITNFFG